MRKIKFRAWDELKNQMFRVLSLHLYVARPFEVYLINESGDGWIRDANSVKLMQSTGLKDKNGREIFEGDIVECCSEGVKAIGEVKRRINGWWFISPSWQNSIMWGLCPNDKGETTVKIVGNIYETPELLGGQNE